MSAAAAVVAILAAAAVLVAAALRRGEDEAAEVGRAAVEPAAASARSPARGAAGGPAPAPPAERVEAPPLPEEDLWAMVPDEHEVREMMARELELTGGFDLPGAERAGAWREVDDPTWADRAEADLRRGLERRVVVRGVAVVNLDCEQGRCLVELTFDGMSLALERSASIRSWIQEDVGCRAYSDGPGDEESPHLADNQQIWILCGEPTSG
jgi:hypothetical protein